MDSFLIPIDAIKQNNKTLLWDPLGMKHSFHPNSFIGMGAEIVALSLNQVGWHLVTAQAVEVTERSRLSWHRNSRCDRQA
jgi:hypothetical protein